MEKLEDSGEGAQKTNQAQGVNPNISLSDREPEINSLTSNDFSGESVLTVEKETTTVSTELEFFVLTVEQELVTLRSESVRSEQIASKVPTHPEVTSGWNAAPGSPPLPISVRSSSNTVNNTSTSNELPREPVLTVENVTITVSTEVVSPVLTFEKDATDLVSEETTQPSNKRRKGEGTGRIQLRTVSKKNGKQYQQFWYDWQVHTTEKVIYKSVYIPKRLLEKIQVLESAKAPVLEILEVLGVFGK